MKQWRQVYNEASRRTADFTQTQSNSWFQVNRRFHKGDRDNLQFYSIRKKRIICKPWLSIIQTIQSYSIVYFYFFFQIVQCLSGCNKIDIVKHLYFKSTHTFWIFHMRPVPSNYAWCLIAREHSVQSVENFGGGIRKIWQLSWHVKLKETLPNTFCIITSF